MRASFMLLKATGYRLQATGVLCPFPAELSSAPFSSNKQRHDRRILPLGNHRWDAPFCLLIRKGGGRI